MGRVGLAMAEGRADGPLSVHFGKAPWIMIAGTESGEREFLENEGRNGRSVASTLVQRSCTDAIVVDIGEGGLRNLGAAGIRAWAAPASATGDEALTMLAEGKLKLLGPEDSAAGHGGQSGCCCSHRNKTTSVCGC